ncbi:hypothetical protein TNCV_1125301 [Trichonephila clavipes]|nr:hypothetical protein TNCV_1125301 [Trichonephila clavipes]
MHSTYVLQKYVKHSGKESITNNPSDEENSPQSETNALPSIFPQNFRNLTHKGSSQEIRFVRHSVEILKNYHTPQNEIDYLLSKQRQISSNKLVALHFKYDQARRRFVEWAQNEIAVVPDFHKRILFSDEAHFWLNGYVNKQNCRIWSEANPQVYVETPLHPEKLTVCCALWAGGIIGPYFFKNDEGHNVTVNGDRYRAMITNFFIPELNNHDVQELWFQQDGATCHTARATID